MPSLIRNVNQKDGPLRISIHYEISGLADGPPVIMVPGWTLNSRLWDKAVPPLQERFKIVRYDPRGSGRSTSTESAEYSRVADAEDLEALLDGLGIEKASLVGHSKGARICGVFAMSRPQRVEKLVYVGSAEPHGGAALERNFRPVASAWAAEVKRLAREEGLEAAMKRLQEGNLFGKLRSSPDGMRLLRLSVEGYQGADLLSEVVPRPFDTRKHVAALTMPVLVICGASDPFLDECQYAAGVLPKARLKVLEGCGHMPMLECAGAFARELADFLGEPQ